MCRMGRPRLHSDQTILDAARMLVLSAGARATTIDAIASASGAPKGSLYHRFASLNDLLARMWMRAAQRAQASFIDALQEQDAMAAALAAAVSLHDFAQRDRADARLLASMRREDLVQSVTSPSLERELAELNRPLEAAFADLARRLFGRATRATIEATACAISDLPLGAIRRHVVGGSEFPPGLRDQLEAAARAALIQAGARSRVPGREVEPQSRRNVRQG
jgi:AcrR family transcriptional regulator